MPATTPQPRNHIYASGWNAAAQRISTLTSHRIAREYKAVLKTLEEGWDILRPLALIGEALHDRDAVLTPDAESVVWVLVLDVLDNLRGLVLTCVSSVPGRDGFSINPRVGDAVNKVREVQHPLRVLKLAAGHKTFPVELAPLVAPVSAAFDLWVEQLARVTAPVAARENRWLCESETPSELTVA